MMVKVGIDFWTKKRNLGDLWFTLDGWIGLTCICSTELRALLEPARGKEPSLEMLLGCSSSPLMLLLLPLFSSSSSSPLILLLLPLLSSSSSPRSDFLLPLRISCSRGAGKVNWWPTRDLN